MPGNRMSSLAIAQYCGQAPRLSLGAGRSAAMSNAFHARCAGVNTAESRRRLDSLTDSERETINNWHKPTALEVRGLKLDYSTAQTEFTLGLDDSGAFTIKTEAAVTIGHADMGWVVRLTIGSAEVKVVVVGDIKRQRFTTPEGPMALQLQAYGHAFAQQHNADYFLPCLWLAEEGDWVIGELQSMFGLAAAARWARIHAAATNDSTEYSHGSHCESCWSRLNCPAHMVRYSDVLAVPGTTDAELTPETALELLVEVKRFEDTAEAARAYLKAWVDRNAPIGDGNGKSWGPINVKGRESGPSVAKLREVLGEDAEQLITLGSSSKQFRWTNTKGK